MNSIAELVKKVQELTDLTQAQVRAIEEKDAEIAAERHAKENAIQQAQQHAMEAHTQRATVLEILRHFGCAEEDWHALELIKAAQAQAPEAKIPEALAAGVPQQSDDLGPKIMDALEASGALVGLTFFHIDRSEVGPHMEALREGLGAAYEVWKHTQKPAAPQQHAQAAQPIVTVPGGVQALADITGQSVMYGDHEVKPAARPITGELPPLQEFDEYWSMQEKLEIRAMLCTYGHQCRAAALEEAAKLIEQTQETHVVNGQDGQTNERTVTPRKANNLMGLAYAAAIRALNKGGAA